jgi:hypothetical protein
VTPDSPTPSVWQPLKAASSTEFVRGLRGTANELQVINRKQLMRFDDKMNLIEKRDFFIDSLLNTPPILSDNYFALFSVNPDNRQILELHFTKSKKTVKRISTALMADTAKKQAFDLDLSGRTAGCFSADGSKLMLFGVQYPAIKPFALLFDIKPNFSGDDFDRVDLYKSTEIFNLNIRKIETCRYFGNNFYIATKEGGFRITQDGFVKKLFNHHTLDFFEHNGKLYSTGNTPSDFYISTNNGLSWQKSGFSDLKYVEKLGTKVFSQKLLTTPFGMADSLLTRVNDIQYPASFTTQANGYCTISFFKNKYVVNIGKDVYMVQELKTK